MAKSGSSGKDSERLTWVCVKRRKEGREGGGEKEKKEREVKG